MTVSPALTLITLDDEEKEVTGGPLHARELEVTSAMNYWEASLVDELIAIAIH